MVLRLLLFLLVVSRTTTAHRRYPKVPKWGDQVYHDDDDDDARAFKSPRAFPVDSLLMRHTDLVDMLLGTMAEYVTVRHMARAKLPPMDKSMKISVLGISYSTAMKLQQGWVENLSTLSRVGNLTASQQGGKISFSTPLSFRNLAIGFEKYTLPIGRIANLSGKINIRIGKNKFYLKTFALINKGTGVCSFGLEGIKLDQLGDFTANITGLEPFNWLLQFIVDALLKSGGSLVTTEIEGKLNMAARKFQASVPCDVLSFL